MDTWRLAPCLLTLGEAGGKYLPKTPPGSLQSRSKNDRFFSINETFQIIRSNEIHHSNQIRAFESRIENPSIWYEAEQRCSIQFSADVLYRLV